MSTETRTSTLRTCIHALREERALRPAGVYDQDSLYLRLSDAELAQQPKSVQETVKCARKHKSPPTSIGEAYTVERIVPSKESLLRAHAQGCNEADAFTKAYYDDLDVAVEKAFEDADTCVSEHLKYLDEQSDEAWEDHA